MKETKPSYQNPLMILKSALFTLSSHPIILYPFILIAFLQTIALEILYFSPRPPLVSFFGPVVRTFWRKAFLHYPYNFLLLPKLFYYSQVAIYLFIGAYLSAVAVHIIQLINGNKTVTIRNAFRATFKLYIHIFVSALLSLILIKIFSDALNVVYVRATEIRSESGIYAILKNIILYGEPYFRLLIAVFVTTIFAYVIPVIIIEKAKIHKALWVNFKVLGKTLWTTFLIIFLPMVLYVPILILRSSVAPYIDSNFPEGYALLILLSIVMTLFIDAFVLTAVTTLYLIKREHVS